MKKIASIIIVLLAAYNLSYTQVLNPVHWEFSSREISKSTYELSFVATIDAGWHMYGLNIPEGGPEPTVFYFTENDNIEFLTDITSSPKPEVKYDGTFKMDLELFGDKVTFTREVKIEGEAAIKIAGSVEFMSCDDTRCLAPKEESFEFRFEKQENKVAEKEILIPNQTPGKEAIATESVDSGEVNPYTTQITEQNTDTSPKENNTKDKTLLGLFLLGLAAGFGALLTPCVYPIIPLTVSFFMRDTTRSKAIFNGLFFGFSIILIYTLVGLIAGIFRIDIFRLISSSWLPNLIIFLIFIALALSFFGLYEITLPSSWSNKIDQRADKGGFLGPFFMALATVVISFSCTGLFAGAVLGSALQGEVIRPVVGMFGFSLAFALPFTLLAIFPGFMNKLPKSGGWLNSVKVFFAFVLLATSLMFVTNLRLDFFTRELAIAILIVLLILLGLYFLGKIKFSHDSDLTHISIPRLFLAITVFSLAVLLLPGVFGYPVKAIAPFIPEKSSYEDYFKQKNSTPNSTKIPVSNICTETPKYADFLHLPSELNLKAYFDYDEAMACARELNKPVLLDFAGHSCKNCKKMYSEVWSDPVVLEKLQNEFIIAVLYTDERTKLSEEDWITSTIDGKVKKTIGKKFNNLQIEKFQSNALPLYAIIDFEGNILTDKKYHTYSSDVDSFIDFLNDALQNPPKNN